MPKPGLTAPLPVPAPKPSLPQRGQSKMKKSLSTCPAPPVCSARSWCLSIGIGSSPEIAPVHSECRVLCCYNRLKGNCSSVTVCYRLRLPVFHLISPDLSARAHFDVAMAAFTLTSTLKSADLGAKIQATGAISGLTRDRKSTRLNSSHVKI